MCARRTDLASKVRGLLDDCAVLVQDLPAVLDAIRDYGLPEAEAMLRS
jgi:hypothetical protein